MNKIKVNKQLLQDTKTFLRYISSDKETPEIVKHHARTLLNSYECLNELDQGEIDTN
jgi:hypothetical protein